MGIFDKAKQGIAESVFQSVLPKLLPMLNPALKKLEDFIGDDDKTILLKKVPGKGVFLFVIDNSKKCKFTKGEFTIEKGGIIHAESIKNLPEFLQKVNSNS